LHCADEQVLIGAGVTEFEIYRTEPYVANA
jgi:hypothetical protein